ncbi:MAG: 23S rRNA pseudouridine2604 synthase [Flavobacteriales bacterium]|jgi:23S rRNA pseudouridine2604 synthase
MMRLNKFLSESGYCSRREADRIMQEGRVSINGDIPEMGAKVAPGDKIHIDGKLIRVPGKEQQKDFIYMAFNKPVGIVCTTDTEGERNNIIDFIGYKKRIFPIGRLDKPSEGLIFLTNDGDMVNKVLRSKNNHEKEYIVTVSKAITPYFIDKMANGIPMLGTKTKKCKVDAIGKNTFKIVLTEGLNRQIRRMCEYLGYNVTKLKRVRIMNVKLDVAVGKWRYLTPQEMGAINSSVSSSSKTK